MPSTYSNSLRLELIASGEQGNTWGNTTNTNIGTLLEAAISGCRILSNMGDADYTMTALNGAVDDSRNHFIVIPDSANLTAQRDVIVPKSVPKGYVVANKAAQAVRIKTLTGTGVIVPSDTTKYVVCDGLDFYEAVTSVSQLTVSSAPSNASHATTKSYVDTADNLKLNLAGGTMTGALTLSGATPSGNQATSFNFVSTNYLQKTVSSPQEMYNFLRLKQAPVDAEDAVRLTDLLYVGALKADRTVKLISNNAALTFNGASEATLANDITVDVAIASTGVTGVTATAPVASTGGSSPNISMAQASASSNGWLSATDWTNFNSKLTASALDNYATSASVSSSLADYFPKSGGALSGILTVPLLSGGGTLYFGNDGAFGGTSEYGVIAARTTSSVFTGCYIGQTRSFGAVSSRWIYAFYDTGIAAVQGRLNIVNGGAAGLESGVLNVASLSGGGSVSSSGGTLVISSDSRMKTNAGFVENGMSAVRALIPRYFYWKPELGYGDKKQLGFYAQEVNAVDPAIAHTPNEEAGEKWGIYDRGLIALLVKAVQELDAEVQTLKAQVG